jgi:hypothetical protein
VASRRRRVPVVLNCLAGLGLVTAAAVVAVGAQPAPRTPPAPSATSACHARWSGTDWLPDPVCTPGALNPRVTPDNIWLTICVDGWATKERKAYFPYPASERVKTRMVALYGQYAGGSLRGYELDHLVPISLGGDPVDPRNLWPEAPRSWNPKDSVEASVRAQVCSGRMSLEVAQATLEGDWTLLKAGGVASPRKAGELDE